MTSLSPPFLSSPKASTSRFFPDTAVSSINISESVWSQKEMLAALVQASHRMLQQPFVLFGAPRLLKKYLSKLPKCLQLGA